MREGGEWRGEGMVIYSKVKRSCRRRLVVEWSFNRIKNTYSVIL
jgi:hypothetical protein